MNAVQSGGEDKNFNEFLLTFLKALAFSYGLTAIVFMVFALILTYTDVNEGYIPWVSSLTTAAACLIGGIISGRGIKNKGLFSGVMLSVFYIIIMLAVQKFSGAGDLDGGYGIPVIIMALGAGGIGGIIGVNSGK